MECYTCVDSACKGVAVSWSSATRKELDHYRDNGIPIVIEGSNFPCVGRGAVEHDMLRKIDAESRRFKVKGADLADSRVWEKATRAKNGELAAEAALEVVKGHRCPLNSCSHSVGIRLLRPGMQERPGAVVVCGSPGCTWYATPDLMADWVLKAQRLVEDVGGPFGLLRAGKAWAVLAEYAARQRSGPRADCLCC